MMRRNKVIGFTIIALVTVMGFVNPMADRQACATAWARYATAINCGDYKAAYAIHSEAYRREHPFATFTNGFHITSVPKALYGSIQHYHSSPVLRRASFAVSPYPLSFPAGWEDGIIPVVDMAREHGTWTIDNILIYAQ